MKNSTKQELKMKFESSSEFQSAWGAFILLY